ncbi:MAG: RHS repeat-associated core domain-containing protein, partial [Ktedonobacterales bacterium]|nr:RHS repeat-associated core domain-containing protein [Ktedonobacterales bacterium]
YNARYYDPAVGQFTSADSDAAGGLNRYAYVGGKPETRTDPSGQRAITMEGGRDGIKGGGLRPCTSNCGDTPPGGTPPIVTPPKPVVKTSPRTTAALASGFSRSDASGGGGCTEVKGQPTCEQIANARGVAANFAENMTQLGKNLVIGGIIKRITGGRPVIGWFVSTFAAPAITALKTLLAVIALETLIFDDLFWTQATQWSDGRWRSRVAFGVWVALINGVAAVASAAVGVAITAVVDTLGGGPEDPVGDVVSLIAGASGMLLNLAAFGLPAIQTLNAEKQALYPGTFPVL